MEPDDQKTPEQISEEARIKLPVLQQLALLAVVLLLIFSSALTPAFLFKPDSENTNVTVSETRSIEVDEVRGDPAFSDVKVTAQAAFVWDDSKQQALYEKNPDDVVPIASLTKLMTALVANELLDENDQITINDAALSQYGSSGLTAGETFDRLSLSDLMLLSSSNDGAYALAYAAGAVLAQRDPANAFVQAMNIRAKEIGLTETYFKNPTGLDISPTEGGAYGTARDMSKLMEYILLNEPSILAFTKEKNLDVLNTAGALHDTENTNYYVDEIPGLIGSKTGFTDLAGGNLVVAFETGLNRPMVVVVLGSTRQERFSDVITLVEEVKTFVSQEQI